MFVNGPELLSKVIGESEQRLAHLFQTARKHAPSIVLIDSIESVARSRGRDTSTEHSADKLLSCLLTEMDGVMMFSGLEVESEPTAQVLVLGVTTHIDYLDPAILRPGRLDHHVYVGPPNLKSRTEILEYYMSKLPLASSAPAPPMLAEKTQGYTGADLENLCREAALSALRENINTTKVASQHFKAALERRCFS